MKATPGGEREKAHDKPEVNEDLEFQHRVWLFERAGWVVMGLVALAALVGLMGPGPLSSAEAGDAQLSIEYERFHRHLAPSEVKVRIDKAAAADGAVTLVLSRNFADEYQIERVVPVPTQWQFAEDGMRLRFLTADLTSSGTVHFYVKPQGVGPVSVAIGLVGAAPIPLRLFIYP